jgi:hypothetical protein
MSKEKLRTDPSSVRFDREKLEFIMKRESLSSKQQVIDLLVNKYWWEFKMPIPTHKESPPLDLKPVFNEDTKIEKPRPEKTFQEYKEDINSAGSASAIEKIVNISARDVSLADWQKRQIREFGVHVSQQFEL